MASNTTMIQTPLGTLIVQRIGALYVWRISYDGVVWLLLGRTS